MTLAPSFTRKPCHPANSCTSAQSLSSIKLFPELFPINTWAKTNVTWSASGQTALLRRQVCKQWPLSKGRGAGEVKNLHGSSASWQPPQPTRLRRKHSNGVLSPLLGMSCWHTEGQAGSTLRKQRYVGGHGSEARPGGNEEGKCPSKSNTALSLKTGQSSPNVSQFSPPASWDD